MSLAYPIARTLEEAIKPGVKSARSLREAAAVTGGLKVDGLETSWLHLPPEEADALFRAISAEGPAGHLQRYEDTSGHTVLAVSWWKLADPSAPAKPLSPASKPAPARAAEGDHTDDLYFRRGRTKTRRRRPADPNQLDLFNGE
ncbi:hypothetical protein [Hyphomonas sp.]|uniref:hypothetical protein n=1 Tax=Hyphomonas sp. TaxID=87 RepID=UPI003918D27D